MKSRKLKLVIVLPILIVLLFWVSMVITDYICSTKANSPVFARKINANDADIYYGVGYTIIIDDGYAVTPPNTELKGYFYWGRR